MQSTHFEATNGGAADRIGSPGRNGSRILRPIIPSSPTVANPVKPKPAVRTTRRRSRAKSTHRVARYVIGSLVLALVIAGGATGYWGYQRAQAALATYHRVTADVQSLESLRSANFSSFTVTDAQRIHDQFLQLQVDVNRLNTQTSVPSRLQPWVQRIPYVGPRYVAGKQVIQVVQLLTKTGVEGSNIGQQMLQAYKTNGLSSNTSPATPTWLDVLMQNMPAIQRLKNQIDQALNMSSQINQSVLPPNAVTKLNELDQLANSHDLNNLINTQLPALEAAFGGDGPARYLVLIQNPSELRPTGGFPGTIAMVTFDRGQLRSYDFYDVYDLNQAYTTTPHDPVQQPWPLAKYAPSPQLSILDASWWSNFPTSAATIMKMYQTTGWPPIKGVVALDPSFVGSMLKITGPMTIDVDGEMRTITAENVHDEIERQRRLARDGQKTEDVHKQVVAIIGKQLIDQFKGGDRATMLKMVDAIKQTADDRDLQIYSADPNVETLIEKRDWGGRLVANPSKPTVAITYANVAFGKSSELMYPTYKLTLGQLVNGWQSAQLEISMVHTGSPKDDPFYSGFQRWWIDVTLPTGSIRSESSIADVPNPEEPNGGSYEVPLMPGTSTSMTIDFVMPAGQTITFRRQPGLHTAEVSVFNQTCDSSSAIKPLSSDLTFNLGGICPAP